MVSLQIRFTAPLAPPHTPPRHTLHSPVLVNNADMLHATKRALQMKHTWTKSISLLLRTLNILLSIVFLDALPVSVSSRSILPITVGGHFFASLRAEITAAPLASLHGTQRGCGPHARLTREQMEIVKRTVLSFFFFFSLYLSSSPPSRRRL